METLKDQLTADTLSEIQVFISPDAEQPAQTYTGYQYIRYLMTRVQPDGAILLDMNFTKEDTTV